MQVSDPDWLTSPVYQHAFSVDTTAPPPPVVGAPAVFDANHNDSSGVPGATPYAFTLKAGDANGVQGFIYAVTASGSAPTYPGDAVCSPAGARTGFYVVDCPVDHYSDTITIAAVGPSTTLTVWAFDEAGNVSAQVKGQPFSYTFTVKGTTTLPSTAAPLTASGAAAWQTIDVTGGSPAANSCTGTVANPDPFSTYGTALELTASGDRATTTGAAVDASQAFSVAAWVCPKATTTAQAVLTQMAGAGAPAAQLGLDSSGDAVLTGWTSPIRSEQVATSTALPAGAWTYVSAVYDTINQQMRITVTQTGYTGTWVTATSGGTHVASPSSQPVVVGDSGTAGANQFIGQVYHPLMVQGVLTNDQFVGAQYNFDTDKGVL